VEKGECEMWDPAYIRSWEEAEDFWRVRKNPYPYDDRGRRLKFGRKVNQELEAVNKERKKHNLHPFWLELFFRGSVSEIPM
jgi:hypothetical protein